MIGPQTSDVRIPSFAHYAQHGAYALSMARRLHVDVRLATQVLLLQVAVVTLTLGIAGGLLAFMSHERLADQYETRSLDMARAIAFAPAVRADVARYDAAPLTPSPALTDAVGQRAVADTGHRDPAAHRRVIRGDHQRSGHQALPSEPGRAR